MAKVFVEDNLQKYEYETVEFAGKNFDPIFAPDLTPKQMLELGIFNGNYFEGYTDEFLKDWFQNAKNTNYFKVNASQSRQEWQRKGWIYEEDPRGWFQWYCRYYMGRRIREEDMRQIKRWKNIRRHVSQIQKYCAPGDLTCRPRQRQAVLHWAYDSTVL